MRDSKSNDGIWQVSKGRAPAEPFSLKSPLEAGEEDEEDPRPRGCVLPGCREAVA